MLKSSTTSTDTTSFGLNCFILYKCFLLLLIMTPLSSEEIIIKPGSKYALQNLVIENDTAQVTTQELDFSQGKWYFHAPTKRLEFHANAKGLISVSKNVVRKGFIFLNAPYSVLVFSGDEKHQTVFTDHTQLSDTPTSRLYLVFPKNPSDATNLDKLNQALTQKFKEILKSSGTDPKVLVKKWNQIPFYVFKKEETTTSSCWNADQLVWLQYLQMSMGKHFQETPQLKLQELIESFKSNKYNHARLGFEIIRRILVSLFKSNFNFLTRFGILTDFKKSNGLASMLVDDAKLTDSIVSLLNSYFQGRQDDDPVLQSLETLHTKMTKLAVSKVSRFMFDDQSNMLRFLFGFTADMDQNWTLIDIVDKIVSETPKILLNNLAFDMIQDVNKFSDVRLNLFETENSDLLEAMRSFIDLVYSDVTELVQNVQESKETERLNKLLELDHEQTSLEYYVKEGKRQDQPNAYKSDQDTQNLEVLKSSTRIKQLVLDLLPENYLAFLVPQYIQYFLSNLPLIGSVGSIGFTDVVSNAHESQWFRRMLMVMGKTDYDLEKDQRFIKTEKVGIFELKNRRLILV